MKSSINEISDESLQALNKHYDIANSLHLLSSRESEKSFSNLILSISKNDFHKVVEAIAPSYMLYCVFYSLLYVVIEGYQELKLQDAKVNQLLEKKHHVEALRRLRNSTFHYQNEPFPEKSIVFLENKNSEHWVHDLHEALGDLLQRLSR
ncbi:MAG: hypothetical protein QNJ31_02705 [Candidatus Caenarcaniphilales bacterium]|nr:hypothetical protein [Candidatus Caenarcaniphilales bacterium]